MPPWTSTRLSCSLPARLRRRVVVVEDAVLRQQPAAADAELRIAFAGEHAFDQLHARPDAAGVLPAAAGAAEPFAEDARAPATSRRSSSCKRPGERLRPGRWPACRRAISAASRLVETASREPLGMSLTLLTISRPRPGPDHARQQIGQALARAFDARRHDAGGDDRRLEQAEVVLGEIEHLGQVGDVRRARRGRR